MIQKVLVFFSRHNVRCLRYSSAFQTKSETLKSAGDFEPKYMTFGAGFTDQNLKKKLVDTMVVYENFVTEKEEKSLQEEFEPYMKRLRYEEDHWDNAIHGYRETERLKWNEENSKILDRVRNIAFPPGTSQIKFVHILDLKEDGEIKPHVDSVRFCGNTIAGLSLLTDSVMRLVNVENPILTADVLLTRRSLYVMTGSARYDYNHAILHNSVSVFNKSIVRKTRRVSVICRNEPVESI